MSSDKKCDMCHPGMPVYSEQEVLEKLKINLFSGWQYDNKKNLICKTFNFKGYWKTIAFVNAIAWVAQKEGHHPGLEVSYNKVVVKYSTHEAGGVTRNDFICAEQVEAL